MISVPDYGATVDATAIIQGLINSASAGETVEFDGAAYLFSSALQLKSGIYLRGKNTKIICPDAGWALSAPNNFGLFNLNGVSAVSVERFSFYGTKNADINHTPKLIYINACSDLTIRNCELQNSAFEGIWAGLNDTSVRVSISGLRIANVGYPAGSFAALPAIQACFNESSIRDCMIDDVGIGIGISGSGVSVTGNRITGAKLFGIGTGDGGTCDGLTITNNNVEVTSDPSVVRVGIQSGATSFPSVIAGNKIKATMSAGDHRVVGMGAYASVCPVIVDNSIDVTGAGTGIYLEASITTPTTALIARNTVKMSNVPVQAWGIQAIPGGAARSLKLTVKDNHVLCAGIGAVNGYAIDANANGGGTLSAVFDRNIKDDGYLRIASMMVAPAQDNLLACSYDNITGTGRKD